MWYISRVSHQRTTVTDQANRINDVDALRGFALFGIFVVNIAFMASAYPGNLVDDRSFGSLVDDAARFMVSALFSMKFYLLFAFLFGYSFTLQMDAARRAGRRFLPRMLRRVLGLFVLGVFHFIVLSSGDVLTTYAVACLVLLAMYRVSMNAAVCIAAGLYVSVVVILIDSEVLVDRAALLPSHEQALANARDETQAMLGTVGEVVGQHIDGLGLLLAQAVSMQGPTALAMFLLGLVAGRRGLLTRLDGTEPVLRRVQFVGFPVGLAGGLIYALGGEIDPVASAISVVTAPFLTAAYVGTALRVAHSRRWSVVSRALAPTGRLALTNYLLQSLVGLVLFTGIGFGLAGTVSPPALLVISAAVFASQIAGRMWWLSKHRYGPAEWGLRWLTNAEHPKRQRQQL